MFGVFGLRLAFTVLAIAGSFVATYPTTPRGSISDVYFGTRVADPYRWLERTEDAQTRQWVDAQTHVTERTLAAMPDRARMRALFVSLIGAQADSLPQSGGDVVAFSRSLGDGRLPMLLARSGHAQRVIIDPNRRWPDGSTTLSDWQLSPNGRYVAYATKRGGLGLVGWHVLDVRSDRDVAGFVPSVPDWAPIAWAKDGSGFYYGSYDGGALPPAGAPIGTAYAVRFHRIATNATADALVFARPDKPAWLPYVYQTDDGRYEVDAAVDGSGNGTSMAIRDVRNHRAALRTIDDGRYDYVGNQGPRLLFFTHVDAERGRVVAVDLRSSRRMQTVIPSNADILQSITAVGNTLVASYLHDDRTRLVTYRQDGSPTGEIALPGPGNVPSISGSQNQTTAYYQFSSPTSPPTTFAYDAGRHREKVVARQRAPFDTANLVTDEFFARSADGTRVPVFVAHRRGVPLNGRSHTLLTGYGGFGDPYPIEWDPVGAAWLARGGTFVIACVRGGGEYGEAWHRAGMRGNKHHAFEDLDAVAQYLVKRRYTTPDRLALYGYSGGGLLVGVTEVEHPDHFGAVVEAAGPVDVLRQQTYGSEAAWIPEVGSPTGSKAQFQWLYAYAPLVHITRGLHYPATMVRTSSGDERVSPAHAYKFAAALQWAQRGPAPVLLYVAKNTGHVGGGTLIQQATPFADEETFLLNELSGA
jgi:prolyl oligopeptidase